MLHYVVLAYGAASLLYMLFFMSSNNRCLKLIFKIIPLLILGFGNTHIILSVAAPFDIKGSDFLPRLSKFNWSLIFCLMGDAYLVFPSLFLYGLFSFAIGQGFLAMMFSDNLHTLSQLTRNELASGVCVLIMSVAIYMYMYPKFKRVMVIPTMIYTQPTLLLLFGNLIHPILVAILLYLVQKYQHSVLPVSISVSCIEWLIRCIPRVIVMFAV